MEEGKRKVEKDVVMGCVSVNKRHYHGAGRDSRVSGHFSYLGIYPGLKALGAIFCGNVLFLELEAFSFSCACAWVGSVEEEVG